jgi:hypothetical protein
MSAPLPVSVRSTGYGIVSDRSGRLCSGVFATYEQAQPFIEGLPGFTIRPVYEGMVLTRTATSDRD